MKTHKQFWKNLEVLNHQVIDFNIIKNITEIDILDSIYDQGLDIEKFKLNSKQYKRLLFNYFIKNVIKYINNSDKKLFFIISKPSTSEFFDYFEFDAINKSYRTNISKLFNLLPIKAYIDFEYTYGDILESKESELVEWLSNQILIQSDKTSEKSYQPIKKISQYYDLQYIDNKIFKELQYKSVF